MTTGEPYRDPPLSGTTTQQEFEVFMRDQEIDCIARYQLCRKTAAYWKDYSQKGRDRSFFYAALAIVATPLIILGTAYQYGDNRLFEGILTLVLLALGAFILAQIIAYYRYWMHRDAHADHTVRAAKYKCLASTAAFQLGFVNHRMSDSDREDEVISFLKDKEALDRDCNPSLATLVDEKNSVLRLLTK